MTLNGLNSFSIWTDKKNIEEKNQIADLTKFQLFDNQRF